MGDNELLCLLDAIPEEDLLRILKDIVDELLHYQRPSGDYDGEDLRTCIRTILAKAEHPE